MSKPIWKPYTEVILPDIKDAYTTERENDHTFRQGIVGRSIDRINAAFSEKLRMKVLGELPVVKESDREENIENTNSFQKNALKWHSRVIIKDGFDHFRSRKLIAYFRGCQIDNQSSAEIKEIIRFLSGYIDGGHSKLFDSFHVAYRDPYGEELTEFKERNILHRGDEFRALTSIYANTIHFSDGAPEETIGTIPIVGTIPLRRIVNSGKPYVHLPLVYPGFEDWNKGPENWKKRRIEKYFPNYDTIFLVVLNAMRKVEQLMIEQSRQLPHSKI